MGKSEKSKPAANRKAELHDQNPVALICMLLAVAVFAVYGRALQNGFVNFDDDIYIYANPHVLNGLTWDGLRWAFTSVSYVYYQPFTWISHMLDIEWFALNPAGHHMVSIFLHAGTSVMLFVWLFRATGQFWRCACTAAIFALHPLRVESVVWAAERKDVLSAFLFTASLIAYSRYVRRPSASRYLFTTAVLTFGLLAKPMLVSAPLLYLIADYWPLRRSQSFLNLVREKVPWFILSAIFAALTFTGQQKAKAMEMLGNLSFAHRVENALISYARYLGKTVWPSSLSVIYPYAHSLPLWQGLAAAVLVLGISAAVFYYRRVCPYLFTGWCWFVVSLLPVIGVVQVGMQAMADRFTYVPSIGLSVAIVWDAAGLSERFRWPVWRTAVIATGVLMGLATLTWTQVGYWHDSISLLQNTVANTGPNPLAEQNLGVALEEANRNAEALAHLSAAVRYAPDMFQAQYNLGKAQAGLEQTEAAIASFSQALRVKPDYAEAYYARAAMYQKLKQIDKAGADLAQALKFGLPLNYQAEAYNNLGVVAASSGDLPAAAAYFQNAVQVRPDFPDAQVNLSVALLQLGRDIEARERLTTAIAATHGAPAVRQALARLQRAK